MFSLYDIATTLDLNINTLRYWLRKNKDDCEKSFYDFNLSCLLKKLKVYKQTKNNGSGRNYEQYFTLDIEEFVSEYKKYVEYVESIKNKKRSGGFLWSGSAIECYNCNMNCINCFNKDICSSVIEFSFKKEPPMKAHVRKLLTEIGKPPL